MNVYDLLKKDLDGEFTKPNGEYNITKLSNHFNLDRKTVKKIISYKKEDILESVMYKHYVDINFSLVWFRRNNENLEYALDLLEDLSKRIDSIIDSKNQ